MPSPTPRLPRPSAQDAPHSGLRPAQTAALAACADALLILLFAAIGRDAHQRGEIITGVFATAWPFLAGAALAWLVLRLWHDPLRV